MPLPSDIKKILLPRFDTLGDIVLLEPFLRGLHEGFKGAEITLLVSEAYDQLAPLFPKYLNWEVWRINPYRNPYLEQIDEKEVKDFLCQLENSGWDLVLFTKYEWTWIDHFIAAHLSEVQQLAIGTTKETPEWLKPHLVRLDMESYSSQVVPVPVEEKTREREKYQVLLNYLTGENRVLPNPKLTVPDDLKRHSRAVLQSLELDKKTFCVCLPGGIENISIKVWPTEKFAEVITWLNDRHRINTLLVGHEKERNIVERVAGLAGKEGYIPSIWLGKDGEIGLLAGLLERARFYLGNDTGPMHIGAALDTPVIALFGGGHWPRFIPNGSRCHIIVRRMSCFYCDWKCSFGDAPCVKDLPLSLVQEAIETAVRENKLNGDAVSIHEAEPYPETTNDLIQKAWETFNGVEADRAARLRVIEDLGKRLQESEADRGARLSVIEDLSRRLQEVEADRAAHLEVIRGLEQKMFETMNQLNFSTSVLPKISLVTACLNQRAYLEKTIRSVLGQKYPNLEYIIIDGGSTDGTLEVIRRFESHLSYWISEPDNGQAEAINKGFSKATGEIISWLNADDTYTEGALWEWVKAVLRYPKADVWMASHHNYIDECDNVFSVMGNIFVNHAEFVKYWKMGGIRVNQPSVFFRRQLLEEIGEIDPHLRYGLDYDFFLRLSRDHRIVTVNGRWANYRLHRDAKSGTPAGEGFCKFIPEWHLASKGQWGIPWSLQWWGFFLSFQFYRPFFNLGQLTSDFISRKQIAFRWLFLWPRFLWHLIRGQGSLPRW